MRLCLKWAFADIAYSTTGDAVLEKLDTNSSDYKSIEKQFTSKWKHNPNAPTVLCIIKIAPPQGIVDRFEAYRQKVMKDNPKIFGEGSDGNTHRRFHGTGMTCTLNYNGASPTLCKDAKCAVCSISRTSLQLSYFKSNTSAGRFGPGLYTTSTSSKSHGYNTKSEAALGQGIRGMFIVHVVVGNGHKMNNDNWQLQGPPAGCHSVLGEVGGGGNLNFDECVVYTDDAICPAYFIVYRY